MIASYPPLTVGADPDYFEVDHLLNPGNGSVDSNWNNYLDLKGATIQAADGFNTCNGWRTYANKVALVLRRFGNHDDIRPGALLLVRVSDLGSIVKVQERMREIGYSLQPWHGEQEPAHMTFMLTQLQPTEQTTRTGGVRTIGRVDSQGLGQDEGQP